jgi:hypothetical protein
MRDFTEEAGVEEDRLSVAVSSLVSLKGPRHVRQPSPTSGRCFLTERQKRWVGYAVRTAVSGGSER